MFFFSQKKGGGGGGGGNSLSEGGTDVARRNIRQSAGNPNNSENRDPKTELGL